MPSAIEQKIRRTAKKKGVFANKIRGGGVRNGLWVFAEHSTNMLLSGEFGMDEVSALEWIHEYGEFEQ